MRWDEAIVSCFDAQKHQANTGIPSKIMGTCLPDIGDYGCYLQQCRLVNFKVNYSEIKPARTRVETKSSTSVPISVPISSMGSSDVNVMKNVILLWLLHFFLYWLSCFFALFKHRAHLMTDFQDLWACSHDAPSPKGVSFGVSMTTLNILDQSLKNAKQGMWDDLVHIWAKRSSSDGNSFMDFHGNKFNFLVHLQLKICLNLHIPSRENAWLFVSMVS